MDQRREKKIQYRQTLVSKGTKGHFTCQARLSLYLKQNRRGKRKKMMMMMMRNEGRERKGVALAGAERRDKMRTKVENQVTRWWIGWVEVES